MGISKTDLFEERHNALAETMKALGHPARIAIVEYLLARRACVCGDIVAELPLAQSSVSQHLKALKEAGIIQGNIDGNAICYCLNPAKMQEIQAYFTNFLAALDGGNCCK